MTEHGTVKWYSIAKGYGFLTRESTGEDVFVHYTAVADPETLPLADGEKVSFEVEDSPKGLRSRNVTPAER